MTSALRVKKALCLIACVALQSPALSAEPELAKSELPEAEAEPQKRLLWGDTHLHTSYSFDAFLNGNHSADPEVAYRFAKGYPVIHPYNRTRVQIETPLDFLVVSDHAEFYGGIRDLYNDGVQKPDPNILEQAAYWWTLRQLREAIDTEKGPAYFADLLPVDQDPYQAAQEWVESNSDNTPPGADVSAKNAWARMTKTAEEHNEPGVFTTLIGWEWSTVPGGANLHRVVISDANDVQARSFMPFGSTDSPFPQDLWNWMDETKEKTGVDFLAIPHNSNISKGVMFDRKSLRGAEIDADYASQRARLEPVVEITQIKGDSETHPDLSPNDPFAGFEIYPWYIQQERTANYVASKGDYIRAAWQTGLELKAEINTNPFEFGVIGSTDSHTGLSSAEEPNFWGKMAYDSIPDRKQGNALANGPTGWSMQAGGLAAVWAEDNSRKAILAAFKRREVYATTGPRIRLRFEATFENRTLVMGAATDAPEQSPRFVVSAQKDPRSANLDRIQIVKGWIDANGTTHEQVFDVAWSDERTIDASGVLTPVGNTVDVKRGTYANSIGAGHLETTWQDPEYNARQSAFYYARVLEIPTPRHSLLDAIALGLEKPTTGESIIQERAYSSPLWFYAN